MRPRRRNATFGLKDWNIAGRSFTTRDRLSLAKYCTRMFSACVAIHICTHMIAMWERILIWTNTNGSNVDIACRRLFQNGCMYISRYWPRQFLFDFSCGLGFVSFRLQVFFFRVFSFSFSLRFEYLVELLSRVALCVALHVPWTNIYIFFTNT